MAVPVDLKRRRRSRTSCMLTRGTVVTAARLLVVITLASCEQPDRTTPRGTTSAAAAHSIVIDAGEFASTPTLQVTETLRIGVSDTSYNLVSLGAIAVGDELYALDSGLYVVAVFDKAGKLIRELGGRGQGPGEFYNRPLALALGRDTLFVVESSRVHAFSTADGSVLYTSARADLWSGGGRGALANLVHTPTGLVAARRVTPRPRPGDAGPYTSMTHVQYRSQATGLFDSSAIDLIGSEWHLRGKGTMTGKLFAGSPHYALMHDGRVAYTKGDTYAISILDRTGTVQVSVVGDVERIPLDETDVADLIRDMSAEFPPAEGGDDAARFLGTVPRADYRQVLGRLIAGPDSLLLVERPDLSPLTTRSGVSMSDLTSNLPSTWDVIRLADGLAGRITLPAGFAPLAFDGTTIYGREVTDLDVQMLVAYRIAIPARPRS